MTTQTVGGRGEDVAAAYLEGQGWSILARNWRCPRGELDLIALEPGGGGTPDTVVFCEVKCRTGLGYGDPLEAITYAKTVKLRELAQQWLRQQSRHVPAVRIDAVGVVLKRGFRPVVSHVRGVAS